MSNASEAMTSVNQANLYAEFGYPGNTDAGVVYALRSGKKHFSRFYQSRVELNDGVGDLVLPFASPLTLTITLRSSAGIVALVDKRIAIEVLQLGGVIEIGFEDKDIPRGLGQLTYRIEVPEELDGYWQVQLQGPQVQQGWPVRTRKAGLIGEAEQVIENLPYGEYVPVFFAKKLGTFRLPQFRFESDQTEHTNRVAIGSALFLVSAEALQREPNLEQDSPDSRADQQVELQVSDADCFTEWTSQTNTTQSEVTASLVTGRYWVRARSGSFVSAVQWFDVLEGQTTQVRLEILPESTLDFRWPGREPLYVDLTDLTRDAKLPRMRFQTMPAKWNTAAGSYEVSLRYQDIVTTRVVSLPAHGTTIVSTPF